MVATIVILFIVALISAFCIFRLVRSHKNGCTDCGGSCGGGCGGNCSGCHMCDTTGASTGKKQI